MPSNPTNNHAKFSCGPMKDIEIRIYSEFIQPAFRNEQLCPYTWLLLVIMLAGLSVIIYCTMHLLLWLIGENWGHAVCLPNYSFTVAGYLGLWEARCRSSVCWGRANVLKEGKPATDSAVFSCRVMLILLEKGARLDRHSSIMKSSVFIQIKILVNPSLGPPLIINTTFSNEQSVHNYVICLECRSDYLLYYILILYNMKDGYILKVNATAAFFGVSLCVLRLAV